jgi:hypothetical protein
MPRLKINNLDYIRQDDKFYHEAFNNVQNGFSALSTQLGSDPNGSDVVPPQIGQVNVSQTKGFVDVAITDNGSIARAINYYLEIATDAGFSTARVYSLGPSRNWDKVLPNGTYWIRAYSQYPAGGPPSAAVNYGLNPVVISASVIGNHILQGTQGSGTGGGGAGKTITR